MVGVYSPFSVVVFIGYRNQDSSENSSEYMNYLFVQKTIMPSDFKITTVGNSTM